MKLTTILYKCFAFFWKYNPIKRATAYVIRALKLPVGLLYIDMRFYGPFKIDLGENKSIKLYHHYDTSVENVLFWKGFEGFENYSLTIWRKLSQMNNRIFDIGSNTGLYALLAATENPTAMVYAFEPSQRTYAKLKQNIGLNRLDQIMAFDLALSDHDGEAVYHEPEKGHQYSASLNADIRKGRDNDWTEQTIQTITIDSFIEQEGVFPSLLKIDVELHEPEVLRGFEKGLAKNQPTILIEVLTEEVGIQVNELLQGKGYKFHVIDEDKRCLIAVDRISNHPYRNFLVCTEDVLTALDV